MSWPKTLKSLKEASEVIKHTDEQRRHSGIQEPTAGQCFWFPAAAKRWTIVPISFHPDVDSCSFRFSTNGRRTNEVAFVSFAAAAASN